MGHRVFIGLNEVAGYFGGLHHGFSEIGIRSTFVDKSSHPFQYSDRSGFSRVERLLVLMRRRRLEATDPFRRGFYRVAGASLVAVKVVTRTLRLVLAAAQNDVFVFGAGQTFLQTHDLRLLRLLRKRVIVVFTGSDHRPPYLSGRWMSHPEGDLSGVIAESRRIKAIVAAAERNGCAIVGHKASAQFHTQPTFNFLTVGIPTILGESSSSPTRTWFRAAGVRILHSPSDPERKGTDLIRGAIQALQSRGLAIDYVEISGRPHGEVIEAVAQCDFVVDEVFGDTPMAVLATEAAWFGKPTVVTGYYAAEMDAESEGTSRPPSMFREPAGLETAIEALVLDPAMRAQLGQDAQRYVRERWAPAEVARRFIAIAEGRSPNDWLFDPLAVHYIHGWGMSETRLRKGLIRMLSVGGLSGLELSHNPTLERRILELVE